MSLFLILMCLLSLSLGHVAAVASWRRKLWLSVRSNDMPRSLKHSLSLPFQKSVACVTWSLCLLVVAFACRKFGASAGTELAFALAIAATISKVTLQPKVHCILHLRMVLARLSEMQQYYQQTRNTAAARDMDILIDRVTRELYAMKIVKSAAQVPTYDGSTLYLALPGAKADNYYKSQRSGKES